MQTIKRFILSRWFGRLLLIGAVVNAVVLGVWLVGNNARVTGPVYGDSITMLTPSVPVSQRLTLRTIDYLQGYNPAALFVYAITNVSKQGDYVTVSLAGFPNGQIDPWTLEQSTWLGSIKYLASSNTGGMMILAPQPQLTEQTQPTTGLDFINDGLGGPGDILPIKKDSTATYGTLGVHDCGFGLTGYEAVDLFPSDRHVYASRGGTVDYVCRDSSGQMSVRIGMHMYAHLIDNGLQVGTKISQGQDLGPVKLGSFTATCGNATQNQGAGHVHFCFIPDYFSQNYQTDCYQDGNPYVLDTVTSVFNYTGGGVAPLDTITAHWCGWVSDPSIPPPSTNGGNFWDTLVSGESALVESAVKIWPIHTPIGLADRVLSIAATPVELLYAVILVNFDMTVTMWVFGVIIALETVRRVYAIYMWIKRAIPVIG